MAALVEKIRHEGTLPGKTLSRGPHVTSRYLLNSSSSAFRDLDVELVGTVMLTDGRLHLSGLAFQKADAVSVSIFVKNNSIA